MYLSPRSALRLRRALFPTDVVVGEPARLAHAPLALGAFCDWCLAGDVVVTCIAALALVRLRFAS